MGRYDNLSKRTKWRYLGIKEEGFDPLRQDLGEMIESAKKDYRLGKTVSFEDMERRCDSNLPSHIFLVMPPNGKRRNEISDKV